MANWFYYFTEPHKLEDDFDNLADSEKLKLLREFLYESDQCDKKMESSRKQNIEIGNINNNNSVLPPMCNDIPNNFPLDIIRDNYIQQLKKSQILSILSLKVCIFLDITISYFVS